MIPDSVCLSARAAAFALGVVFVSFSLALAQEPAGEVATATTVKDRSGSAGHFDFYVLALTWSPSFCAGARERAPDRLPRAQCDGRPFAFVVHGLWPQYELGFPSYCQRPAPRISRTIIDGMLDLMPSPNLVIHQWRRHGTCSGLDPQAYFAAVRKARAAVTVPPDYRSLAAPVIVSPASVAEAFIQANPGLSYTAFAVSCDRKRLTEVRVCLTKDFAFRACTEVTRRACRRDKVAMPAVRGR
jgi:ribonuclease T2